MRHLVFQVAPGTSAAPLSVSGEYLVDAGAAYGGEWLELRRTISPNGVRRGRMNFDTPLFQAAADEKRACGHCISDAAP